MFFLLSKTIYFFLMPLGIITITLLCAYFIKIKRWKKRLYWFALSLAILFTNPFLANEAMSGWEESVKPIGSIPNYDYAVVLTGVADNRRLPQDRVYFNKGADRVTHTFQLYKLGKIKKIIISGGSGSLSDENYSEAETLERAFLLFGVPKSDLILEEMSKNTHQSAINCTSLLPNNEKILLISSSFHLKRARGCFNKTGIQNDVFPVDFYSSPRRFTPDAWIPNSYALNEWSIVFREIIGVIAYKMMGYL